jgi:polyphosphate kinase
MDRNLNRRVESLVLIEDKAHKAELIKIFDQYLDPTIVSWHLLKDGNWKRVNQSNDGKPLQDLHAKMIKLYKELV